MSGEVLYLSEEVRGDSSGARMTILLSASISMNCTENHSGRSTVPAWDYICRDLRHPGLAPRYYA